MLEVTIGEALRDAVSRVEKIGTHTPMLDAEVLLCDVLNTDRLHLIINKEQCITDAQLRVFGEYVEKRLAGVPVQYIIKSQEFMGMEFYVEEGVLIPRPDTEILVEAILEWVKEKHGTKNVRIADIGAGSGAISISLAKLSDSAFVYATDISPKALEITKINSQKHQVENRMEFLSGDLLTPLRELGINNLDVLVSNPPYIPTEDIGKLQVEVACYEPALALDGGADGLDFYRSLVHEGWHFLKEGGLLAFEVGHDQALAVKNLIIISGKYNNIKIIKDLAGIQRVVTAKRHGDVSFVF